MQLLGLKMGSKTSQKWDRQAKAFSIGIRCLPFFLVFLYKIGEFQGSYHMSLLVRHIRCPNMTFSRHSILRKTRKSNWNHYACWRVSTSSRNITDHQHRFFCNVKTSKLLDKQIKNPEFGFKKFAHGGFLKSSPAHVRARACTCAHVQNYLRDVRL